MRGHRRKLRTSEDGHCDDLRLQKLQDVVFSGKTLCFFQVPAISRVLQIYVIIICMCILCMYVYIYIYYLHHVMGAIIVGMILPKICSHIPMIFPLHAMIGHVSYMV